MSLIWVIIGIDDGVFVVYTNDDSSLYTLSNISPVCIAGSAFISSNPITVLWWSEQYLADLDKWLYKRYGWLQH